MNHELKAMMFGWAAATLVAGWGLYFQLSFLTAGVAFVTGFGVTIWKLNRS